MGDGRWVILMGGTVGRLGGASGGGRTAIQRPERPERPKRARGRLGLGGGVAKRSGHTVPAENSRGLLSRMRPVNVTQTLVDGESCYRGNDSCIGLRRWASDNTNATEATRGDL